MVLEQCKEELQNLSATFEIGPRKNLSRLFEYYMERRRNRGDLIEKLKILNSLEDVEQDLYSPGLF